MRSSSLVCEVAGAGLGPAVVLVHGVGVGPEAFGPLAELLVAAGHAVVTVHRPGYGRSPARPAVSLDDQADDLVAVLDHLREADGDGPAALVGVSGGATLALLAAARLAHRPTPAGLAAPVPVVAHEPLVGPLAPSLHRRVARAVADLASAEGGVPDVGERAVRFVRHLVGEATWSGLDPRVRAAVAERADLVVAEALAFAGVAPTRADLDAVRRHGRLTTTVGVRSGRERWLAASTLASLAGAHVEGVPLAGHLAHVDAPPSFARLVLAAAVPAAVGVPATGAPA